MSRRDLSRPAGRAALGASLLVGALAALIVGAGGAPLGPDGPLLSWAVGHRPQAAAALARAVTATGTGAVPYAAAAAAGLVAARTVRRRLGAVALCVACLAVGQALRYELMELIHRPRPPRADWAAHPSGWAFPSGHSTSAALAAGLLILAVTLRAPRGAGTAALRVVIGCWGAAVGATRVYLGVHWCTDVVGGWLFAVAWLGVCLWSAARWLPASITIGAAPAPDGPPQDCAPADPGR
ncbi:phosphatase PAP2 family protein [Streptomyces sp. NPDC046985]|uniref:phosphatase PAP2 family protein n=1 Tax=Streptomyces sp. NPDC046985 TaxID=3155377 RepID=UPI0034094E85